LRPYLVVVFDKINGVPVQISIWGFEVPKKMKNENRGFACAYLIVSVVRRPTRGFACEEDYTYPMTIANLKEPFKNTFCRNKSNKYVMQFPLRVGLRTTLNNERGKKKSQCITVILFFRLDIRGFVLLFLAPQINGEWL
jgi:hypothetical protein